MPRAATIALAFTLSACGARTPLHSPPERDAGRVAPSTDAGVDVLAERDAGTCGAPAAFPVRLLETETMRNGTLRTDVRVDGQATPGVIAESWTWIARGDATHLDLAHAPDDTGNWWVDNFILFEAFDCEGTRVGAAVVGFTNDGTVWLDGDAVPQIGRASFEFLPGEIHLDDLVPSGALVHLHATALDYSDWVSLGELWVIAR